MSTVERVDDFGTFHFQQSHNQVEDCWFPEYPQKCAAAAGYLVSGPDKNAGHLLTGEPEHDAGQDEAVVGCDAVGSGWF